MCFLSIDIPILVLIPIIQKNVPMTIVLYTFQPIFMG